MASAAAEGGPPPSAAAPPAPSPGAAVGSVSSMSSPASTAPLVGERPDNAFQLTVLAEGGGGAGAEELREDERAVSQSDLLGSMDAGGSSSDGMPVTEDQELTAGSTIPQASFNFVNSIVGAGIIGIPFAIYHAGFFAGLLLLIGMGILTDYSVRMLIAAGIRNKTHDYEELGRKLLGQRGFVVINISMWIGAYGAQVAYMVIIGDTVPKIFEQAGADSVLLNREFIICLVAVVVVLPLCLLREMTTLSFSSLLSIVADAALILIVIAMGPGAAENQGIESEAKYFDFMRPTIFAGLGAISFAFVCQHSSFIVFRSLHNNTGKGRWEKVTHISVGTAAIMCLTLGLAGYCNFYNQTKADILNNFPNKDAAINVARALLALTMVFTFPMEQFVARHCVNTLLFNGAHMPLSRHVGITLTLWVTSVAIALATDDLGVVLEFTGSIAGSMLAFILPAVLHIQTHRAAFDAAMATWRPSQPGYSPSLAKRWEATKPFCLQLFMIFFGIIALFVGATMAILVAA